MSIYFKRDIRTSVASVQLVTAIWWHQHIGAILVWNVEWPRGHMLSHALFYLNDFT